jgi:hypothetical protein
MSAAAAPDLGGCPAIARATIASPTKATPVNASRLNLFLPFTIARAYDGDLVNLRFNFGRDGDRVDMVHSMAAVRTW